jgi:hypothetical protein
MKEMTFFHHLKCQVVLERLEEKRRERREGERRGEERKGGKGKRGEGRGEENGKESGLLWGVNIGCSATGFHVVVIT